MKYLLLRLHRLLFTRRALWSEELLAFGLVLFVLVSPAQAVTKFEPRSLFMYSTEPSVTTTYDVSLRFVSPAPVGAVDMLFCEDPIPYMPCVSPPGLDVSGATLTNQTGETGFSITQQTSNHIVLSRTPTVPTSGQASVYTFSGVVNPAGVDRAFAIRLTSLPDNSFDTSDYTQIKSRQIDVGSVRGQVTNAIIIETQVPPMLIFCLAEQVDLGCTSTNNNYYSDMGTLNPNGTLTAQSQFAVGTNATAGFAVATYGGVPAAGTNVIDASTIPTESRPGTNQFGINVVANSSPNIGANPDGPFANGVPAPNYGIPDKFLYNEGDVIAESPNVSLMRRFTVSYILNSDKDLKPGVYTTTLTFIASGRF